MLFCKMKLFKENNCRLCRKVFCCVKCRLKHEEIIHEVCPECDICIYGKTILRNPSDNLLLHIKDKHWPLHCLNCKRNFASVNEITSHNKCRMSKKMFEDTPTKTPVKANVIIIEDENDSNYDSPPVMYPFGKNTNNNPIINLNTNNIMQLTTSTPMQGDTDNFMENICQQITPLDNDRKEGCKMNSEMIHDQPKEMLDSRRVTFNETPIFDVAKEDCPTKILKGMKKAKFQNETKSELSDITNDLMKTPKTDDTLWSTAISDTPKAFEKGSVNSLNKLNQEDNENYEETAYGIDSKDAVDVDTSHSYSQIWSSIEKFKNVVSGLLSISSQTQVSEDEQISIRKTPSNKRLRSDSDLFEDVQRLKKMKLTEIKCRKPINSTVPYRFSLRRFRKMIETCDKSTQTSDDFN